MKNRSKSNRFKNLEKYKGRYEFKDNDKILDDINKKRKEKRYYK